MVLNIATVWTSNTHNSHKNPLRVVGLGVWTICAILVSYCVAQHVLQHLYARVLETPLERDLQKLVSNLILQDQAAPRCITPPVELHPSNASNVGSDCANPLAAAQVRFNLLLAYYMGVAVPISWADHFQGLVCSSAEICSPWDGDPSVPTSPFHFPSASDVVGSTELELEPGLMNPVYQGSVSEAQYLTGECLMDSSEFVAFNNPEAAVIWYSAAATNFNHVEAKFRLGTLFQKSAHSNGLPEVDHLKLAHHWLGLASADNHVEAQVQLAVVLLELLPLGLRDDQLAWDHPYPVQPEHSRGRGIFGRLKSLWTGSNPQTMLKTSIRSLLESAASSGSIKAKTLVGIMEYQGVPLEPSKERARAMVSSGLRGLFDQFDSTPSKSALQDIGFCLAMFYKQGFTGPPVFAQIEPMLQPLVDDGHIEAMFELALVNAEYGNHAIALEWYAKASAAGHPEAQYRLGLYRYHASGPDGDQSSGLRLLQQAAQGPGHAQAAAKVATLSGNSLRMPVTLCYLLLMNLVWMLPSLAWLISSISSSLTVGDKVTKESLTSCQDEAVLISKHVKRWREHIALIIFLFGAVCHYKLLIIQHNYDAIEALATRSAAVIMRHLWILQQHAIPVVLALMSVYKPHMIPDYRPSMQTWTSLDTFTCAFFNPAFIYVEHIEMANTLALLPLIRYYGPWCETGVDNPQWHDMWRQIIGAGAGLLLGWITFGDTILLHPDGGMRFLHVCAWHGLGFVIRAIVGWVVVAGQQKHEQKQKQKLKQKLSAAADSEYYQVLKSKGVSSDSGHIGKREGVGAEGSKSEKVKRRGQSTPGAKLRPAGMKHGSKGTHTGMQQVAGHCRSAVLEWGLTVRAKLGDSSTALLQHCHDLRTTTQQHCQHLYNCLRVGSKPSKKGADESCCAICIDAPVDVVLLPCRHMCLCGPCADELLFRDDDAKCPMCRTRIEDTLHVYLNTRERS